MKKLLQLIQQYFGFSRSETRGFLVLVMLMVAVVIFQIWYRPAQQVYDPAQDRQELDSLVSMLEERAAETRPAAKPLKLYAFNPNKLSQEEWEEMGLPKYVARNIINYRAKAGDFKTKEQLGKIYGLPDSVFQQLYPYIQLPAASEQAYGADRNYGRTDPADGNRPAYTKSAFRLEPFDLNQADTTQLKKIRGIGSKLSARIITFRDNLGGFYSDEQLAEVFGLVPEVIDSLKKYSFIEPAYQPNTISLNTVTYEDLRKHPYLKPYTAKAIIAYRDQHGGFKQIEDIRKIKIVDEALFQKLRPYLSL